jgi:acetoin utilization deacetylase AcuC-like enzyme
MTTRLMVSPEFEAHEPGPMHPESPARLRAIRDLLSRAPVPGVELRAPRRLASRDELLRVHSAEHLATLEALSGQRTHLDPDTAVSPKSIEVAWLAAGASVDLTLDILRGDCTRGFALVRPPGHHAERDRAMGFCLLNNVAVAAAAARAEGAQRILIVDWDVHHGNGTQRIFYDAPDVLYVSTHQYPFYPGTGDITEVGRGAGLGFTINCPLEAGQTDADFGVVFTELVEPVAHAFQPDLVLVSAGFDAHRRDPLGQMRLTERGFAAMCTSLMDVAASSAQGRIALFLEGGYDLDALAASAHACLEVLANARRETFPAGGSRATASVVRRVKDVLLDTAPAGRLDQPRWRAALARE